jgi:hypothetical protein
MSKRNAATNEEPQPHVQPQQGPLAVWAKTLISLLLAVHLTAVFIGPFAFACNAGGSTSPLADAIYQGLRPYLAFLYLDHGYFFFAPNPGPNHLVDYRVEFADGRPPVEGRFPNLATERPRLLYHRYFMLSEALTGSYVPPQAPAKPSPPPLTASVQERTRYQLEVAQHREATANWQRRRTQYEAMRASMEQHLLKQYGAQRVSLTRIEHRPPLPDEFASLGQKLNAAESYVTLSEATGGATR